jgi:hypothetical protein
MNLVESAVLHYQELSLIYHIMQVRKEYISSSSSSSLLLSIGTISSNYLQDISKKRKMYINVLYGIMCSNKMKVNKINRLSTAPSSPKTLD